MSVSVLPDLRYLEEAQVETVSDSSSLSAVTGFYFAFRVFFVLIAVRALGLTPQTGVGASLACDYLLLLLALFSLPKVRREYRLDDQPCLRWVGCYFLLSGASLLWSAAASPLAAFAFWIAMAADAGIVALQLLSQDVNTVARSLLGGFVRGASLIAVSAWLLPAQSDLRLGDEELLGPNQIGWVCGLGFFFAQYLLLRGEKGRWKIHATLLAVTVLRSLSKTAMIAFLIAQIFILLRDRSIPWKSKLTVAGLASGVLAAFSGLLAKYYQVYISTGSGNQAESLTGRLGIWVYLFSEALERPWLGHGFHSVWKVVPVFYGTFEARHAHNEMLQQFYAYGVAGIGLIFAIYASVFVAIRRLANSSERAFWGGLLLFVLVRGLADTEAFDLSWPMWFLTLFGAMVSSKRAQAEVSLCA